MNSDMTQKNYTMRHRRTISSIHDDEFEEDSEDEEIVIGDVDVKSS